MIPQFRAVVLFSFWGLFPVPSRKVRLSSPGVAAETSFPQRWNTPARSRNSGDAAPERGV